MAETSGIVPEVEGVISSEEWHAEYYHYRGKPVVETTIDIMMKHCGSWWNIDEDGNLTNLVEMH